MSPQNQQNQSSTQSYMKWITIIGSTFVVIGGLYGAFVAVNNMLDDKYLQDATAHKTTQKLISQLKEDREKEMEHLRSGLTEDLHTEHDATRLAIRSLELKSTETEINITRASLKAQLEVLKTRRDFLMSSPAQDAETKREIEFIRTKIDDINSTLSML